MPRDYRSPPIPYIYTVVGYCECFANLCFADTILIESKDSGLNRVQYAGNCHDFGLAQPANGFSGRVSVHAKKTLLSLESGRSRNSRPLSNSYLSFLGRIESVSLSERENISSHSSLDDYTFYSSQTIWFRGTARRCYRSHRVWERENL